MFKFPTNIIRKRLMIEMRGYGHTLAEIGKRWNVSRERVRQIIGNTPYPKRVGRCKNCGRVVKKGRQFCDSECMQSLFRRTREIKPYSGGLVVELKCAHCECTFERPRRNQAIYIHQSGERTIHYCPACCKFNPWNQSINRKGKTYRKKSITDLIFGK